MKKQSMNAALVAAACALAFGGSAMAAEGSATLNLLTEAGNGKTVGTVAITENKYGLVFTPALTGLTPGLHGFHVHEKGSCAPAPVDGKTVPGQAAGGHYDPDGAKKHGLPWGEGHKGDLPGLVVDASGNASNPVLAPRLKLADVKGRALMVHVGGDNHADHPAPLGGGGARMACGVIQ
jgi:Cu-Zn family superoxide dismutase